MRMRPAFGPPIDSLPLSLEDFAAIPYWSSDDHAASLAVFQRSAAVMQAQYASAERQARYAGTWQDWQLACEAAFLARDPRSFFERHFIPCLVKDPVRPQGLFTGYYEPLAEGRLSPEPGFEVPIYARPDDLVSFGPDVEKETGLRYGRRVSGKPVPYLTRREIEQGALKGRGLELVWLSSWVDAFFIHIQGSGRISLPGNKAMRLAYAAKSGRPYTAIGGVLVERGEIRREDMSMQSLRRWMAANPAEARELMWENESFVFFRGVSVEDESLGAPGAQKVNLTPLRSMAVDRDIWPFGLPVWLDLMAPSGANASLQPFRQLMIAQDTGSAIKGHARGDVYWGWGDQATMAAGHMASPGTMIVLLPTSLAQRLAVQR